MATSFFRNKNNVRPKKTGAKRRRRLSEQRQRLMALGVSEDKIVHMTTQEIRVMLTHPTKIKKAE